MLSLTNLSKNRLISLVIFLVVALLFFNSVLVYAPTIQNTDTWPMTGHDPQHTGYSTSTAPSTNEIKWISNATIPSPSRTPVIADGRLIIATFYKWVNNGAVQMSRVYAVNSSTGEYLWSYETAGYGISFSSPTIDSGRVYACGGDSNPSGGSTYGHLFCLNASTGSLLWKSVATGDSEQPTPLVSNGKIYLSTSVRISEFGSTSVFYCLNATDGSIIWSIPNFGSWTIPPAIFNDLVFIAGGYSSNTLYAVNANTGVQVWNYTASSISSNTILPIISNGKVFISSDSNIICLDATTGTLSWTSLYAQVLAVSNDRLFAKSQNQLYCLNAITGSKLWNFTSAEVSMAAVANNKIIFSAKGSLRIGNTVYDLDQLYCLDVNSGTLVWNYSELGKRFSYPAVADNTVYVYGTNAIYAFGKNDTIPMSLSLSLNSGTSLIGFKIILSGKMQGNVTTTVNQPVKLSYSVTGGTTWNEITVIPTSNDGTYSAIWQPSATGVYLVKASWNSSVYPFGRAELVEVTRMLSVNSFDNQNVFSVASNSTLSALAFNSTSKELSFTVSGDDGTTGFVDLSIAKSLISNIADVTVNLDGKNLTYTATSAANAWLLHFTYTHSTHNVNVELGTTVIPEILPSWMILALLIMILTSIKLSKQKLYKQET